MKLTSAAKSLMFSPPFSSSLNILIRFWKSFFWKTTRFGDFCPKNQHLPGATLACCDCLSWFCVFMKQDLSPINFCFSSMTYATHLRIKRIPILFFTSDSFQSCCCYYLENSLCRFPWKNNSIMLFVFKVCHVCKGQCTFNSFSCPLFLLERSWGQQL